MSQTCKGICEREKAESMHWGQRYQLGQKRCSLCDTFFVTPNFRCPCCQTKLRSKPRSRRRKIRI